MNRNKPTPQPSREHLFRESQQRQALRANRVEASKEKDRIRLLEQERDAAYRENVIRALALTNGITSPEATDRLVKRTERDWKKHVTVSNSPFDVMQHVERLAIEEKRKVDPNAPGLLPVARNGATPPLSAKASPAAYRAWTESIKKEDDQEREIYRRRLSEVGLQDPATGSVPGGMR